MLLLPAIDLYGGKAVRLYKGDYAQMTVYHDDPCAVAKIFAGAGASFLHLVDLEGAKTGETPHLDLICRIKTETCLSVEVGGGVRDMRVVRAYLDAGIDRVILGTAAVKDPTFLDKALETYGARVAVGVDIRDGFVAVRGWTEKSEFEADAFLKSLQNKGVKTVVVTDISRDGAMKGPNTALYRELAERYRLQIVASGGVSSINDIEMLRETGVYGAILGKAYYTGAVSLDEALAAAAGQKG